MTQIRKGCARGTLAIGGVIQASRGYSAREPVTGRPKKTARYILGTVLSPVGSRAHRYQIFHVTGFRISESAPVSIYQAAVSGSGFLTTTWPDANRVSSSSTRPIAGFVRNASYAALVCKRILIKY